jgi:Flp pilus assembly protein TadG
MMLARWKREPDDGVVARIKTRPHLAWMLRRRFWPSGRALGDCQRAAAALEFVLVSGPLLILIFGFVATSAVFYTWSTMQSYAQYAARMMSTGQIKNLTNGPITTSNTTATVTCSGSIPSTAVEYYACNGLPNWVTFTATATENCAVPSVAVSLSVSASSAAIADVLAIFTGKTLVANAVLMKEGQCP